MAERKVHDEKAAHMFISQGQVSYLALKAEGYCCPGTTYFPLGCFTLVVLVSVFAYIAAFIRLPIKYTVRVHTSSSSSVSPSRLSRTTGWVRLQRNNTVFNYRTVA